MSEMLYTLLMKKSRDRTIIFRASAKVVLLLLCLCSSLWAQNAWIKQTSGVTKSLEAVGVGGTIVTSPDGVSWTSQNSGVTADLKSIVWTGTQLVAVGYEVIVRSANGVYWTKVDSLPPAKFPLNVTASYLNSVTWTGSQLVAVGLYGVILTSPDGAAWTAPDPWGQNYRIHLYSIIWTGSQLVAVGERMSAIRSPDGAEWTVSKSIEGNPDWRSVIWTGTQLICAGGGSVFRSADGAWPWEEQPVGLSGSTAGIMSVVQAGERLVSVGPANQYFVAYDGMHWNRFPLANGSTEYLNAVIWTGTTYIAVGRLGVILTSPETAPTSIAHSAPHYGEIPSIHEGSSSLRIRLPASFQGGKIQIILYDPSGKKRAATEVRAGMEATLPIAGIGRGIYTLKVSGAGKSFTRNVGIVQ
jgi:hypothetical protein